MEGNLIPSLIEVATGFLIYRPAKRLAESILLWIRTVNLDNTTIRDFAKYNFPRLTKFFKWLKKKYKYSE